MLKWLTGGNTFTEQEAENKLLSEKWHTYSKMADLDKIKYKLPIKYYLEVQSNLEYYCQESEINYILSKHSMQSSERTKYDIRHGIPIKYTHDIMLGLFNVDATLSHLPVLAENYKTRFISIFKNRDPKNLGEHVPYLSYFDTFEENLPYHFLNDKGIEACKELLWLLFSVVPSIEFCPFLLKIISFSLIFLTKEEVFAMVKNLIISDYSNNKLDGIRFRLRFNYEENKRLIPSFIECFLNITNKTGKELEQKFEKLGFEFEILVEDMFFTLFYEYFNFLFLHKIFLLYLREGVKVLFRIAYAILKTFKNEILEISNHESVIKTIKTKCNELKDLNVFFQLAFSFKITQYNNKYSEIKVIETFKPNKMVNYYIPTINGDSGILTDDDYFNLWSIFPNGFKTKDAKLIYSTEYHGHKLSKVYEICSDPDNSCFNSFFVIQTANEVFGAVMSLPFDRCRNGYYKPAHSNLFILKPVIQRFDIVIPTDKLVLCSDDKIIIGLGELGPAIEIEKDLLMGFSYKSEIFNSPQLCEKGVSFGIEKLEIFILY
jgi:hypothetical protein